MRWYMIIFILYFLSSRLHSQSGLQNIRDSLATIDNQDATVTQLLNNEKKNTEYIDRIYTDSLQGKSTKTANFSLFVSDIQNNIPDAASIPGLKLVVETALEKNVSLDTAIIINNGIPLEDIAQYITSTTSEDVKYEPKDDDDDGTANDCPEIADGKIKDIPDLCEYNPIEKIITKTSTCVVAIISMDNLEEVGDDYIIYNYFSLQERLGLCHSEQFTDQPSVAIGTGFLLDSTHVITAFHNLQNDNIKNLRLVVGYELYKNTRVPQLIFKKDNVYKLDSIVYSSYQHDYVVVTTKQVIKNRTAASLNTLPINYSRVVLHTIGYPLGLPMKVAKSGRIKQVSKEYLLCSLDCYVGNSGSPVFNSYTGQVVGILLGGEIDLVRNGNCYETKKCGGVKCSNEMVLPISTVVDELKSAGFIPK